MTTTHRFAIGDSALLPEIEPDSVHLIVTSPPYPMISMWDEQFAGRDPRVAAALEGEDAGTAWLAMHDLLNETWSACARVLAPGGFLIVNVGDAVRTVGGRFGLFANHARVLDAFHDQGLTPLPAIIWRKPTNAPTKFMGSGMLPGGAYVTLEHEYILIARKGEPRRPSREAERMRRRRSAIFWEERNAWFSDLWEPRGTAQTGTRFGRQRSAAYPFEIPFRLIAMYSWEADTVLDPFSGTGTTALAAAALGRNSVSLELEPEAHRGTVERFSAAETIGPLVARQRDRIEQHRRFAGERASISHENAGLGLPVVTRQESDLRLLEIETIERVSTSDEAAVFRADHRDCV